MELNSHNNLALNDTSDHIRIRRLRTDAHLISSPWRVRSKPPTPAALLPVVITVDVLFDTTAAGTSDDFQRTVDYSALYKGLIQVCQRTKDKALALEELVVELLQSVPRIARHLFLEVELPKALLQAAAGAVVVESIHGSVDSIQYLIKELRLAVVIGVNPHERTERQEIYASITFFPTSLSFGSTFPDVSGFIVENFESSYFSTIEALAEEIATKTLRYLDASCKSAQVRISKPAALPLAEAAEVIITRSTTSLEGIDTSETTRQELSNNVAAIALGSNLGDRFQHIESALRMLEHPEVHLPGTAFLDGDVVVKDTSFLYETAPMYVIDQPRFINSACLVETKLPPHDFLKLLKLVEERVGRAPGVRYGPRVVDLDIITFGSAVIDTRSADGNLQDLENVEGHLIIPHPRMTEREFVLRPLKDIAPNWVHPVLKQSVRSLLSAVLKNSQEAPMYKVMPFPSPIQDKMHSAHDAPNTSTYWTFSVDSTMPSRTHPTYIMATLNVTPDSFSDGATHNTISTALSYVASAVEAGADIIDIGGYSTRPGAPFVSTEAEIQRIVPVIEAIRNSNAKWRYVLISVDTFRWEVAKAAILAGANCINDVYAFSGPVYPPDDTSLEHFTKMKEVAFTYAVPVIMMHSRGDAGSNKDYSVYRNPSLPASSDGDVITGIRAELGEKVSRAIQGSGGIRRWMVMVDPGIGFSKTVDGNLEILRNASQLTADVPFKYSSEDTDELRKGSRNLLSGFPQLIGTSRKSFLGTILARPSLPSNPGNPEVAHPGRESKPNERDFATAAAVSCVVQQSVAVVRVHDVHAMADVVRIASALRS